MLAALRQKISGGNAVAFVGAGVSIATTTNAATASWVGLIKNGVQRCMDVVRPSLGLDWAQLLNQEIDSGDLDNLLSAAEKVTSKLNGQSAGEYARWLRETIGQLHVVDSSLIETLQLTFRTSAPDYLRITAAQVSRRGLGSADYTEAGPGTRCDSRPHGHCLAHASGVIAAVRAPLAGRPLRQDSLPDIDIFSSSQA